jgi:hypothetical protein
VEVFPMADKSGFAPQVLIKLKPFSNRSSEPFRRILFIAPKIKVSEIIVQCGREHKAVFVGNARKKTDRVINVYFVSVESAPPIPRRRYASAGFEYFSAQFIGEFAVIMANDFDP